jgi:hypothetical protein
MNVGQLIEELRKFPPHRPVRVVPSEVFFADEVGEGSLNLCDDDATEADEVHDRGSYVLIQGR